MKVLNRNTNTAQNPVLANAIDRAAVDLELKLKQLDYQALPLSDYGKRYYAYDLRKLRYMLKCYAQMLYLSVSNSGKKISDVTLLDHGSGIGIFSLLAKHAGVGTVICQDINPTISNDAKMIARTLGIAVDHFVSGDTKDFVAYVKGHQLKVDVLGSRNVIEHVYDMNDFFKIVAQLPADKLQLYLSTTANMQNPLVDRYTRKIHRAYEYDGKPTEWGGKERDIQTSCLNIRKKIIREKFAALSENSLNELATRTRGLMLDDIYKRVEYHIATGKLPEPLLDPTNTCDPYTGNWAEHLVAIDDYKKMAELNGFNFDIRPGFYNTAYPQKVLNLITPVLNLFIRILGKRGFFLAPFMMIIAEKQPHKKLA